MKLRQFWTRHMGRHGALALLAAVVLGAMGGVGLRLASSQAQAPYLARSGTLSWQRATIYDDGARILLDLGNTGPHAPWNGARQARQLRCAGVDVETAMLIGTASLLSQPDGWLSQEGVSTPMQVRGGLGWLESLAQKVDAEDMRSKSGRCEEHASWKDAQWREFGDFLLQAQPNDPRAWTVAREQLRRVAQDQRLAQLVLGGGLGDTEGLEQTRAMLEHAGARLRRATGQDWGLGLNGRVALMLIPEDPTDPLAGTTRAREDGLVVDVLAEVRTSVVLHEWFHAMDLVAAPLGSPLARRGLNWTDQRMWLSWRRDDTIDAGWVQARAVLDQQKAWHHARNRQAWEKRSAYWQDDAESYAFSFELWARHDLDRAVCKDEPGARPQGRPNLNDAACMMRAWQGTWPILHTRMGAG